MYKFLWRAAWGFCLVQLSLAQTQIGECPLAGTAGVGAGSAQTDRPRRSLQVESSPVGLQSSGRERLGSRSGKQGGICAKLLESLLMGSTGS
jgi:hypothetical protein